MKKRIALICAAACILGSLAGCGKQEATEEIQVTAVAVTETTAPQISEDTLLIMELMGNYLNREQPRHETAQYRFGLRTTANKVPVYQYDDLSFTPNGEVEYWNSKNVYTMAYGNVYTINIEEEQQNSDLAINGYEYPEIVQRHWAPENYCSYYFTTDRGTNVEANTSYGALSQRGFETQYVFSALDQNFFEEYMTEKISSPGGKGRISGERL